MLVRLAAASLLAAAAPSAATAPPVVAASCPTAHAQRCTPEGCTAADDGVIAEQFELDLRRGRLEACLYTDCFHGQARLVRDRASPALVTAFAEVRSSRRPGSVPPPGSAPFPVVLTVNLDDGRFTAVWGLAGDGLRVDFGTCTVERAGRR